MKEKATIVTHNGDFHSDEIMGVAILLLALQAKAETKVIRTRDENLISQADIVLDVGGIYDPDQNRFDHHQAGGAGIRENSIPYASCGLVWKKYGSQLCDNNELIAKKVEDSLIIPIDAGDNGIDTYKQIREEVGPVTLQNILSSFAPTYLESYTTDEVFLEVVSFAKRILEREIAHAKAVISAKDTVTEAYNKQTEEAGDKRLLILDQHLPWFELVADFQNYFL
jgi:uncharacterized UPF0160 family protein